MPSKPKRLTKSQLAAYEASRNLGAELLQSIQEMKAGQGQVVLPGVPEAGSATDAFKPQVDWTAATRTPGGGVKPTIAALRRKR